MAFTSPYLLGGAGVLAVAGISAWVALSSEESTQTETIVPATISETSSTSTTIVIETDEITLEPTPEQRDFQTMAVEGREKTCAAPRPPLELASKAYIRNSYAAILEIMAAERQKREGNCDCYLTEIAWSEVVSEAKRFETTDTPIPPFNLSELRATAEALNAEQQAVCSK
ncbi:MAG: hypothetical protein ACRBBS_12985 [Thalassovita sp.]